MAQTKSYQYNDMNYNNFFKHIIDPIIDKKLDLFNLVIDEMCDTLENFENVLFLCSFMITHEVYKDKLDSYMTQTIRLWKSYQFIEYRLKTYQKYNYIRQRLCDDITFRIIEYIS